jgi:hypothetical protein
MRAVSSGVNGRTIRFAVLFLLFKLILIDAMLSDVLGNFVVPVEKEVRHAVHINANTRT